MKDYEQIAYQELAQKTLEETKDYIDRDRYMASFAVSELERQFVSSMRFVAMDGDDSQSRLTMRDALSEYAIRNIEPPYHLVMEEIEIMSARGKARAHALSASEMNEADDAIEARHAEADHHKQ